MYFFIMNRFANVSNCRIFKILRQFAGAKIMYRTAVTSFQPLSLTAVMLFLFFFIAASLIFIFEPCVTPDCTFEDVFNTGYFVIITLTTVGFGDQIPSNNMARFVAVITMLAGAVFLSMPIAVIGNQFENAYNDHEKELALKDPIQRKRIMAERHAVNTRNRKQLVLNTAISLTCYVCRVTEFDKKYHTGPKSPNKSVEELMQNGDVRLPEKHLVLHICLFLSWKLKVLKQGLLEGRLKSRAHQKILEIASQLGLSTKYAPPKNRL